MKKLLALLFVLATVLPAAAVPSVIPEPEQMSLREGSFVLGPGTKIIVDSASGVTGRFLAERLRRGTGFPKIPVLLHNKGFETGPGNVVLSTAGADASLGAEGYELAVTPDAVVIRAPTQAGMFYGVQTLLQLLPADIFAARTNISTERWEIPCLRVKDQPRFAWRGLMLDVSRHFFTKDEVEKILDAMALYKLNTFHFHLVDDPGWRLEIKKYPRLTSVGAWRNGIDYDLNPKSSTAWRADAKYGGFYTQKDIREIVRYAAARHITVVPEIEMPGHSAGALAPYPQYSCFGGHYSLDGDDAIFCPGNEQTFVFLENILSEVFKMFPGQFVHVGGDEVSTSNWQKCPKCQARMKAEGLKSERQLESYLIQRIEKYINAHGKRLIGWSEIAQGGLAKHAAVMDWIGGGAQAARMGHDVVMSPASPVDYCYLDHYQSLDKRTEPVAIGGFLPLQQVYRFDPMPHGLAPQYQKHILGGQGNLWTEFVASPSHAEYMIFPRECAMAEVLWSPKDKRNWNDFLSRVKYNEKRLDGLGVNYRRNPTRTGEKNGQVSKK